MIDPVFFSLAVLTLLATPGPTNTLLLTSGAMIGKRSWPLIPTEIAGYLIAVLTIGHLLGAVVADISGLGMTLRALAAAYLMRVAIRLWRRGAQATRPDKVIQPVDVFLTTLFNPKALLFGLDIIPLHQPDAAAYLAAFSGMIAIVGMAWIGAGMAITRGLLPPSKVSLLPRFSATVISGFAGYLVAAPFF